MKNALHTNNSLLATAAELNLNLRPVDDWSRIYGQVYRSAKLDVEVLPHPLGDGFEVMAWASDDRLAMEVVVTGCPTVDAAQTAAQLRDLVERVKRVRRELADAGVAVEVIL